MDCKFCWIIWKLYVPESTSSVYWLVFSFSYHWNLSCLCSWMCIQICKYFSQNLLDICPLHQFLLSIKPLGFYVSHNMLILKWPNSLEALYDFVPAETAVTSSLTCHLYHTSWIGLISFLMIQENPQTLMFPFEFSLHCQVSSWKLMVRYITHVCPN